MKDTEKKTAEVVAAYVRRGDRFFVCRRPANKARGLLWEFAGGKVEPGEDAAEALARECREELGVAAEVGDLFAEVTHDYPDLSVHLSLYHASFSGEPQMLEHAAFAWILPEESEKYEFCPADLPLLEKIRKEDLSSWEARIPLGVWRHYKGNLYRVEGVARHSETLEPVVVYRALYGEGKLWVRPARMWLEPVAREGGSVPRFAFVGA